MKLQLPDFKRISLVIWFLLGIVLFKVGFSFFLRLAGDEKTLVNNVNPAVYENVGSGDTAFVSPQKILSDREKFKGDSWLPMTAASIFFEKYPKGDLYDSLLRNKTSKFIYPPSSVLVFYLPHRFMGVPYASIAHGLDHIAWLCIFLVALLSATLLLVILKDPRFNQFKISTPLEVVAVYVLVCYLTFRFFPITYAAEIGQIQTELTLLGTLSLLFWQLDKKYVSGILIGIVCLIKPQLGLLLVWGTIRKQWKMVIGGLAVIIPCMLVSIGLFGFKNHLEYLSVLSFLSHHGEAYFTNQSMNGLMNRFLFNGYNLYYSERGYPPYSPVVYATTMIFALLIILPALFWNYKSKNPGVTDMSIIILASIMASPIAWDQHYGMLLPIFISQIPFAIFYFRNKKWALLIFCVGFILASRYIVLVRQFADSRLNLLQSYLFFGAIIELVFLFWISNLQRKVDFEKVAWERTN